jgi:hypothetical protein
LRVRGPRVGVAGEEGKLLTVSLTPTKLSVISTFSEEMATYGMPSIEGIIRQAMSDDTAWRSTPT